MRKALVSTAETASHSMWFAPRSMKPAGKSGAIIPVLLMVPNLAWMRFQCLAVALLSAPLMGIPPPLALSPVALLVLASHLMNSR